MPEDGMAPRDPAQVEIIVKGHLSDDWAGWFGCTISRRFQGKERQAVSVLRGKFDQSAIYGLLGKTRDLGLPLVSVRQMGEGCDENNESEGRTL